MSRRGSLLSCALRAVRARLRLPPRRAPGRRPTATSQVTTLAKGADKTGEPIAMAVLPDRRVLHTSRDGRVWLTTPNATTSLAGTIPVYSHDEDGLQGIAIDADFATNRWVYVYYAPPLTTPAGRRARQRRRPRGVRAVQGPQPALADQADRGRDAGPRDRAEDPPGPGRPRHLLPRRRRDRLRRRRATCTSRPATTPTRSSPTATPRSTSAPTRNPAFDAQRTSANTNDLRGKLLRIKVARRRQRTRCPAATCSRRARRARGPRSTRWASATRSASRSTRRPAGSTSATTAPTPAARARPAAPAARSSST